MITDIKVIGKYKAIHVATDVDGVRHRKVYHPNEDVSGEDDEIIALANEHWTDEVKTAWQNKRDADIVLEEKF